ncbi:MAG: SDR family NAD(P)-dependent oxidoreductase, partial [Kibdelosporangium sp.]
GSLDSVRELAGELLARYPRIDVLANNAGGQSVRRTVTGDGHEMTFQVNYLAPFLLTGLLLDRLKESPDARVISTSSVGHKFGRLDLADLNGAGTRYWTMKAYANWKLGNVLFTRELARRSKGTSVTATAFHPGTARSDFFRDGGWLGGILASPVGKLITITPEQGAEPLVHLATLADPQSVNGAYFDRMKQREPKGPQATDDDFAHRLWDRTEELLGVTT